MNLWNRIRHFIKDKFLTKKFLSFGIIGIVNTGMHMLAYWICYDLVNLGTLALGWGAFVSNTVAFLVASIFSYFANVIFTFKPTATSTKQFSVVMLIFLIRLLLSNLLTSVFDIIVIDWFHADYSVNPWMTIIAPFFASALLFPIAYLILEYVFKKTDCKKTETK
jgi:putative flippase GtrA